MSASDGVRSGGKAGLVAEDASAAEASKAAMVRAEIFENSKKNLSGEPFEKSFEKSQREEGEIPRFRGYNPPEPRNPQSRKPAEVIIPDARSAHTLHTVNQCTPRTLPYPLNQLTINTRSHRTVSENIMVTFLMWYSRALLLLHGAAPEQAGLHARLCCVHDIAGPTCRPLRCCHGAALGRAAQ